MLSFLLSLFALFSNLTFAMEPIVHKYALDNGFTVLIHPIKSTQNVSTQLWINVGSKHESDDEKGLAHWLEHMCFKGTEKLSETDIQLICSKLSGSRNAVTNYDRTHFYLNFPTQHWHEALPILSDMMSNCTFKQDLLNAELQVVIQEMKNNRDNFDRTIKLELMAAVFPDHPYHYPVIGYKSDLISLSRDKLNAFYKKHYVPNNATLVIVGNVDPKEALELAKKHFAAKTPNFSRTTTIRTSQETITSKSLKIYRSIKNPLTNLAYKIPGMKVCCSDISVNLLCTLLTGGQNSRLYKKLVEDLKLVSTINMHTWNLHDYCMLWISFIPLQAKDNNKIIKVIQEEIDSIAKCGPTIEEMDRVLKSLEIARIKATENNHLVATNIGSLYLATGNETLFFEEIPNDHTQISSNLKSFCSTFLRAIQRHKASILPIDESDTDIWQTMQAKSNQEDAQLLKDKARISALEEGKYVHTIHAQDPTKFEIPKPETCYLSNGLKVLSYQNDNAPLIEIRLQLKFDKRYQPHDKAPLHDIHTAMLLEGTKKYSKEKLLGICEQKGITFIVNNSFVTMNTLKNETPQALELLTEGLCNPLFEQQKLDKHKQLALFNIKRFWDNPETIMSYLMGKHLYQKAGFFKEAVGTPESIEQITLKDITELHTNYYSPSGAVLVITGNLKDLNITQLLENTLAKWQGPDVPDMPDFNESVPKSETDIVHHINREQILLGCIGLSVTRKHEDYYKLTLFNTVFNTKLFDLRQNSNAMYWIQGSLTYNASNTSPGEVCIKTQVSPIRVKEVQALIANSLEKIANEFSEDDLNAALQKISNNVQNAYATNSAIADTILFLENNDLPYDYMVACLDDYKKITVQEVRDAVKKVLNKDNLTFFMVGPTV